MHLLSLVSGASGSLTEFLICDRLKTLIFGNLSLEGTTIGYGDLTPSSSVGKIAVAMYAIMIVNAMAVLLEPGRNLLAQLCRGPKPKQS